MAVTKYIATARKLQTACNRLFGVKLLINTRQWFSDDQNRAVTQYVIMQTVKNDDKNKDINIELFKTYSQVQLVLFMRDKWYELNGWEIPHNNEEWEEVKNKYNEKVITEQRTVIAGRNTIDNGRAEILN